MVIPLKKTTREGEPYHRRAEIEQALSALDDLAPGQLVERLTCTQHAVPFEVLIYFLRHTELELGPKYLEPIFCTFYGRLEVVLQKVVSGAWIDHAASIREELSEQIIEMIAKDRGSQEEKMYYWEVNFNDALSKLRTDVLRKHGPARKTDPLNNARPLTEESDNGEEVSHEVDIAAAEFINPSWDRVMSSNVKYNEIASQIFDEVAFEKKSATLILGGVGVYAARHIYIDEHNNPMLKIVNRKFIYFPNTFYMSPGNPLRHHLERKVTQLFESGLIEYWALEILENDKIEDDDEFEKSLTFNQISGTFYLLGAGICVSFILFFCELCNKYFVGLVSIFR